MLSSSLNSYESVRGLTPDSSIVATLDRLIFFYLTSFSTVPSSTTFLFLCFICFIMQQASIIIPVGVPITAINRKIIETKDKPFSGFSHRSNSSGLKSFPSE